MRKPSEIATAFAPRDALDGKTSFFLVGIGGAGMSALARLLRQRGLEVRGTDSTLSPEVERLREEGIEVHVGHSGEALRRGTGGPPVPRHSSSATPSTSTSPPKSPPPESLGFRSSAGRNFLVGC
ncbi:Mur ligase domain-containing protein [Fimbriimonas ginsengisoli]|uniref:UDP-N-acetylmuramate--L-alanine ligase n=1 Tax=Fimbriimonas ginsengisoli Gsoil 348 TaxID=661478 RepID=A0A068NXA8_FIMGI|nr:Mur ligase domain-containing protein [Fimbriimonas ginsengisoli]AIE88153.1 UDP-N-acetylmuramate--L-alanine ligase [Fimbriimonas ginsengisoli Gsoil 348]